MIPLYKSYSDEADIQAVSEVIRRGMHWAEGPNVALFEERLRGYLGVDYALACNSGTSALHMAIAACGIRFGDEVIVPSFTFIATANCVRFVGAKPVFSDIEEETFGLDAEDVLKKINGRTRAIIAVHYAGCPARDIDKLRQIAEAYHLYLIEDMAESMGATRLSGHCAILSLCANKIISTGEGGALITNDQGIHEKTRLLRSHGRATSHNFTSNQPDDYVTLGYNFRMSDMTAALGVSQLAKIDRIIEMRRQAAGWYRERLQGLVGLPPDILEHVYQLFTVRTSKRNQIMDHLSKNSVMSRIYFSPVHRSVFYQSQVILPVTEQISSEVLSLPMYPGLTEPEVDFICDKVKEAICQARF